MKVFRIERNPSGFKMYADGSEEFFLGENVFIAIGRWAAYFPKFFQISLFLDGGVWWVKKRFGCWETVSGVKKVMKLSFESEVREHPASLDDLFDLLGSFLYMARSQIDVDFRWKERQEFSPGHGKVLSFQAERKTHSSASL